MRSHVFDAFNSKSVISFLCAFKLACDTNEIHEAAVVW